MNRQQVLELFQDVKFEGLTLSKELPYESSGEPLYLKSVKKIFVDSPRITLEPFISKLNGEHINSLVTSITVFVTLDAKSTTQPTQWVNQLTNIIDSFGPEYFRKTWGMTTQFEGDLIVHQFEYVLTKLL